MVRILVVRTYLVKKRDLFMKIESKRKAVVVSFLISIFAVSLFALSTISLVSAQYEPPPYSVYWFQKPNATDYAPSDIPDFDQKQNESWTNPWDPYVGNYSWCGPTAVANSLWWWDSHIDGGEIPPPEEEDHFPLVQNYGPWDDHDPRNVQPLIQHLAQLMKTDNESCGTDVYDMQAGISEYLTEKGLNGSFQEWTWFCNFTFEDVIDEFEKCEDIIFLLGFYQEVEVEPGVWLWVRVGGHYVTLTGVGFNTEPPYDYWVKISDPCLDWAETMQLGPPYVKPPGHMHNPPGNTTLHNDATFVSHDPYKIIPPPEYPQIKGVHFGIEWYPWDLLWEIGGFAANGPVDVPYDPFGGFVYTAVEYVIDFSPIQYDKPAYPDYAPSKMPDFDQRQDGWFDTFGRWSHCGPVAMANSLWWFDSKYENNTIPPPMIIDNFPLVQNYGPWDDHDVRNVEPLVNELAWLMDTNGKRTGIPHNGTYVWDMQNGTRWYFELKGLNDTFYERTWFCNFTFADVEYEVEKCEDVILLLGFYEFDPQAEQWFRFRGHYVTVSGVNANGTIKFSDPAIDAAEWWGNGEVLPPGHTHPGYPQYTMLHNDTLFVSHDYYSVRYDSPISGVHWGIWDYPYYEFYEIAPNEEVDRDSYGGGEVFVGVEYAVVVSPRPAAPPPPEEHDVAIIDKEIFVNPSKYPSLVLSGAYESYPTWGVPYKVNVTVTNEGDYTETFTVSVLLQNATGNYTQGTQPVNNLAPGATTNLIFSFAVPPLPGYPDNAPAAWPYPTYTVWANASVVPGGTDTADNQLFDGTIKVKWPGDADGNGEIKLPDLVKLAKAWYGDIVSNPSKYNYVADFDMNGEIKLPDLVKLAKSWYKGPLD